MSWSDRNQRFGNSYRNDTNNFRNKSSNDLQNNREIGNTSITSRFGQGQGNHRGTNIARFGARDSTYGSSNLGYNRNAGMNTSERQHYNFGDGTNAARSDICVDAKDLSNNFKRERDNFGGAKSDYQNTTSTSFNNTFNTNSRTKIIQNDHYNLSGSTNVAFSDVRRDTSYNLSNMGVNRNSEMNRFDRDRKNFNIGSNLNGRRDIPYDSLNNGYNRNSGNNNFEWERDNFGGGVFSNLSRSDLRSDGNFEPSNINIQNAVTFIRKNENYNRNAGISNMSRSDSMSTNGGNFFSASNNSASQTPSKEEPQVEENERNRPFSNTNSGPYSLKKREESRNINSRTQWQRKRKANQGNNKPLDNFASEPSSSKQITPSEKNNNPDLIVRKLEVLSKKMRYIRMPANQKAILESFKVTISIADTPNHNDMVTITLSIPEKIPNSKKMIKNAKFRLRELSSLKNKSEAKLSHSIFKEKMVVMNKKLKESKKTKATDIKLDDESYNVKLNLHAAITDVACITESKANEIKTYLSKKIEKAMEDGNIVRFKTMHIYQGELQVISADENSLEWLRITVAGMPQLWENSKLRFVHNDTKLPYRIKVYLPGPVQTSEMILKKLGGQNPKISVEQWEIYQSDRKFFNTQYYIGVDKTSLESLIKSFMKMYFEFERVEFTLVNKEDLNQFNVEISKLDYNNISV